MEADKLFIHKDISLDYSAIVNIFVSRNQRRMHFINPLNDWNSWFYPDIIFKEHNFCNSKKKILKLLEIESLMVSISKLHHYTNFSDQPPLSQYPGSAPADSIIMAYKWTLEELHLVFQGGLNVCKRNSEVFYLSATGVT